MKKGTKMSNAIERIKGYCTKATRKQWDELVRAAHAIGVNPSEYDVWDVSYPVFCVDVVEKTANGYADIELAECDGLSAIPFPDFLAKLRGEEWTPKAGEMVDAHYGMGCDWEESVFIGMDGDYYVCRKASYGPSGYRAHAVNDIRPLLPTITRAEAEAQLGKRIID